MRVVSGTALGADDFTIIAYNKFGGTVTPAPMLEAVGIDGAADGLHFMAVLTQVTAPNVRWPCSCYRNNTGSYSSAERKGRACGSESRNCC